jgi:hypothetical protein
MEHKAVIKNTTGRNAAATPSATPSHFSWWGVFLLPLLFCIARISLTNELNRADCEYPVHRTERNVSQLFYMDDLKLLGRCEEDLVNEIIVKAISKDVNMNFGFENVKDYVKKSRTQSKLCRGRTFEKDIKELNPREACMYLGIDGSHDIEHKIDK